MDKYKYLFIDNKQIFGVDEVSDKDKYLDLSSNSWIARQLSMFNVKDEDGNSVYDIWKGLYEVPKEDIPLGMFELIYILCLSKEQLKLALSINAITDSKYNNIKVMRAIMAVNLLYKQRKIDYITNIKKFLYWYWANCSYIVRWVDNEFKDKRKTS